MKDQEDNIKKLQAILEDKINQVKAFINEGDLERQIKAEDHCLFPITKFVSMDDDGMVRVVVGGKCPSCESSIVRNVQTRRYCIQVLTPVICSKFSFARSVKSVLTTDSDFVKVVEELGGRCMFVKESSKRTKMAQYKEIMDFNPTIDGAFKFTAVKPEVVEDGSKELELEDKVTRDELLKRYNFFWSMDEWTSLIGKDGSFITGMKEIVKAASDNNLPYGFMVAYIDNKVYALRCLDNNLLKNHKFITIKFD